MLFLLTFTFTFALILPTTLAGATCTSGTCCQCTCCSGVACSPSNVGSVSVQSCSGCTDSVCSVNFPTPCPASGSGTVISSCTSGSGGSGTTVWGGTYVLNNACSTTQCCCFTGTFTLTQSGSTISGTVGLSGQCGGSTSTLFTVTLPSPTATSFSTQVNGQTLNVVKNGVTVTITNTAASQCSSTATCTSGDCLTSGSSTCFHASTRVSYKGGAPQGLADFHHHEECHIPHVVRSSNGVRIDTSCSTTALRVTGDHLIYSARGLLPASALRKGDVLYADLEQSHPCTITRVTHENKEEEYFGLNCLESDVLANGLKASTFGSYHWIPSTWMKYVSKVVGIERASRWGDSLVTLLSKIKLI